MMPFRTFIFLAILLGAFTSCENDPADIRRWIELEAPSREVARDVEILYSDSAVVRVKIEAPTLINYLDKQDPRKEFPDGIDVVFYDNAKQVSSTMVADYAILLEEEDLIIARYNVVLKGEDGRMLQTEELFWNEKEQRLYTEQFAVLTTGEEKIFGVGFEAKDNFRQAKIKLVKGRLQINEQSDQQGNDN